MNILDGTLVYAAGLGTAYLIQRFWPKGPVTLPTVQKVETVLDGFGQQLGHAEQAAIKRSEDLWAFLQPKIQSEFKTMNDAVAESIAALQAKHVEAQTAAVAAAVAGAPVPQAALDAAKAEGAAEADAATAAAVQAAADAVVVSAA
jgi:hypothetical protein